MCIRDSLLEREALLGGRDSGVRRDENESDDERTSGWQVAKIRQKRKRQTLEAADRSFVTRISAV